MQVLVRRKGVQDIVLGAQVRSAIQVWAEGNTIVSTFIKAKAKLYTNMTELPVHYCMQELILIPTNDHIEDDKGHHHIEAQIEEKGNR